MRSEDGVLDVGGQTVCEGVEPVVGMYVAVLDLCIYFVQNIALLPFTGPRKGIVLHQKHNKRLYLV